MLNLELHQARRHARRALIVMLAVKLFSGAGAHAGPPDCGRPEGEPTVLKPGWILDVERGERIAGKTVLVRGGCIAEVGDQPAALPPGARVIDLPGITLLPGLIDVHVHLAWGAPAGKPAALVGAEEARATLDAGFTTVRNLGSTGWADFALRDAIERGETPGPRMLVSGPGLGLKGGVCDRVFQGEAAVTSAQEAAAKVRELVARGADVIKLCAGGTVLPTSSGTEPPEFVEAQIRAIVEEAHRLGRRVAAHAQGAQAILNAARAGVDSIEHGAMIDEEGARLMKEKHVFLVPTLHRLDYVIEQAGGNRASSEQRAALVEGRSRAVRQIRNAARLGVPMALGTDATVIPHGTNARELPAMAAIGLSPAEALAAATVRAAELLGLSGKVGVIHAGSWADLVGVACDPLGDLSCMQQVRFVMKAGRVRRDQ